MKAEYNVDMNSAEVQTTGLPNQMVMLLTRGAYDKMVASGIAKSIVPNIDSVTTVYPYSPYWRWQVDNFGPIWIPAKGATLTLTPQNYPIYERAIRVYEHNKFEMHDGKFWLNDQPVTQYTFRMNYYWMMGDNRHESQDSRYWGFVPEDHIVGEAALIWMSWDHGVRWRRLFKKIK
jgi:signal peptidase I